MNTENDNIAHVETFDGYLAELIRLQAEKQGKSPEELILSFFEMKCIAPGLNGRKSDADRDVCFCR